MNINVCVERSTAFLPSGLMRKCGEAGVRESLISETAEEIRKELNKNPKNPLPLKISTLKLRREAERYSEQLVFDPDRQIDYYFHKKAGMSISRSFSPLYYDSSKRGAKPSDSAVAAIGEAVAAIIAKQIFQITHVARPINDFPDIILGNTPLTELYLVEAKGAIKTTVKNTLNKELVRLSSLVSSAASAKLWKVTGLLIGTQIEQIDKYKCIIYEVKGT